MLEAIKKSLDSYESNLAWGIAQIPFSAYAKEYDCAIAIAHRYVDDFSLQQYNEPKYNDCLHKSIACCDQRIEDVKAVLDNLNIQNIIPQKSQTDEQALLAPLSFKYAAVKAGIGWIGKNGVLITEKFGPRIVLRALLVQYPFNAGKEIRSSRCAGCMECVKACPGGFIKGAEWNDGIHRKELVDINGCNCYRSGFKEALGRKHACGLCILSCPMGR